MTPGFPGFKLIPTHAQTTAMRQHHQERLLNETYEKLASAVEAAGMHITVSPAGDIIVRGGGEEKHNCSWCQPLVNPDSV